MNELTRALYMGRAPGAGAAKRTIKALTSQRMRRRALWQVRSRQLRQPSAPDEELMRELRIRFTPEVEALSAHLGRDMISFWGYDRLG
jgi:hypothetical protein